MWRLQFVSWLLPCNLLIFVFAGDQVRHWYLLDNFRTEIVVRVKIGHWYNISKITWLQSGITVGPLQPNQLVNNFLVALQVVDAKCGWKSRNYSVYWFWKHTVLCKDIIYETELSSSDSFSSLNRNKLLSADAWSETCNITITTTEHCFCWHGSSGTFIMLWTPIPSDDLWFHFIQLSLLRINRF